MRVQTPFEIALYLIANLFRVFVMMWYIHSVFERKNIPKWIDPLAYFAYFSLNSGCYLLFNIPIINLLTNVVPLILLTMLRKGKMPVRLLAVAGGYAAGMLFDSILLSAEEVLHIKSVFLDSGAATSLGVFSTVLLLERLIGYGKHKEYNIIYTAAIVLIPFLTIIIGMFTMGYAEYEAVPEYVIIECAVLLLINGIVFILFDVLSSKHQQELEQMHLREQNRAYLHQIEIVEQEQSKIRYLRHDIKNHLSHIRELAKHNASADIIEYVDQAVGSIAYDHTKIDSGNQIADSILNLKLSEAEAAGAEIHTEIAIPTELPISAYDFNIIIGNLLDNSIAAMKQCDRKVLYVKLKYAAGSFCILVRNTYHENGSNKKHPDHGLGLKSVRRVIDQYDGALDITKTDEVFTVSVILYLKIDQNSAAAE